MKEIYTLAGNWKVTLADGSNYDMVLPGTLDTNNIGYADKGANQWHPEINLGNATEEIDEHAPIATRFTRKHTYERGGYTDQADKLCTDAWNASSAGSRESKVSTAVD